MRPGSVSIGGVGALARLFRNYAPIAPFQKMWTPGRAAVQTIPVTLFTEVFRAPRRLRDSVAPRAFETGELESLASEEPSTDRAFTHEPRHVRATRAPLPSRRLRLAPRPVLFTSRLGTGVG